MNNRNSEFEFVNRIEAQRQVLQFVNKSIVLNEKLFGLTRSSIERWRSSNSFRDKDKIVNLLLTLSEHLLFLANESQQQITQEYSSMTDVFYEVFDKLKQTASAISFR